MDGPEQLEDGARPTRRAAWLVLGVAVVVVGGLGAVRVTGVLPDLDRPVRTPTPSVTRLPAPPWPSGVGSGTLYVLDAAGVATVDVASGLVQRSPIRVVHPEDVVLTAGGYGVVVWFDDGAGTPRLVTVGGHDAPVVGPVLARGEEFVRGTGTGVWTSSDASSPTGTSAGGRSTWRLVDVDDTVSLTRRLPGWVQGDGAGGLFALDDARVHHVDPAGAETTWVGSVGAVGPDGYEATRCEGVRCRSFLHDLATGVDTPVDAVTPSDGDLPVLSPGNRWSASVQQQVASDPDDEQPPVVRVQVAGGGRVVRSFPAADDDSTSLAWVSDRWLAMTAPDGFVLYDVVDDRVVAPDLDLTLPRQLVHRSPA